VHIGAVGLEMQLMAEPADSLGGVGGGKLGYYTHGTEGVVRMLAFSVMVAGR
jgi:hypothetical protein